MTDQEILASLQSDNPAKGLRKLYQYFPIVKRFVIRNGGESSDAEDVFQEALIVLLDKAREAHFSLTASLQTFLFSICKYMWKAELQKRNKEATLRFEIGEEQSIEQAWILAIEEQAKSSAAAKALALLGDRCWDLIKAFYYEGNSMAVIAVKMGFSSEKIAKNQKYKCLEKARTELATYKLTHS